MKLLNFPSAVASSLSSSQGRILVTGAGGWFGLATLEMLEQALGPEFDRRVFPFARSASEVTLRSGRRVVLRELGALEGLPAEGNAPVLAHYAFLTREKVKSVGVPDYIRINRELTRLVTAEALRLGAAGIFSTSSGAVYRKDGSLESDLDENPYGFLKLEEEAAVDRLRQENGVRAAVCRVFNVSGPYLNKEYAIGSLIEEALFEPQLQVRARQKVYRSFAHVADIVSVGFAVALGVVAAPARPYDTAGDETVEVGELAERIRRRLGCPAKPIVRAPLIAAAEDDRYVGDFRTSAGLAAAAGIRPLPLDEQIADTAAYLKAHR
jgi:UDP-glucuronate decarboxylase